MPALDLAIYDLDRTITRAGTYSPFLIFWASKKAPWRLLLAPLAVSFMGLYAAKLISRKRLKELMQSALMGAGTPSETLEPLIEEFAEQMLSTGIYQQAIDSIAEDRGSGRQVMIATAAHEFYVRPIASRLNVDEVIATRSARSREGAVLAQVEGENCYGAAKLSMIKAHLDAAGIDRSNIHVRFYSDHVSDLPVFDWADEPVAVNPSPRLKAIAEDRGWKILDWRSQ